MRNIFNKYFAVLVAILSLASAVFTITAFYDTKIIDSFIFVLAKNEILLNAVVACVVLIIVFAYSQLIKKIIFRERIGIFLSFAHSSREEMYTIRRVISSMNNFKIFDFSSITIGQDIQTSIKELITASSIVIIFFDEGYFQSDHCLSELELLLDRGKVVIPILKSSEMVSKIPPKISALKYLVISDDYTWENTFRYALYEQYRKIRGKKRSEKE
jgi:hypothetical protein